MSNFLKYMVLFVTGALGYGLIEVGFRGHTHWTMLLLGGLCFVLLFLIATRSREAIWKKWLMGGTVITTLEFLTGLVVNILLDWNVWSYGARPFNLLGQVCLLFFVIWVLLSIPAMWFCRWLDGKVFHHNSREEGRH